MTLKFVRTSWTWARFKARGVLAEWHSRACACSYCERPVRSVDLWLPPDRSWNSWRIVVVATPWGRAYLRFTRRCLRPPDTRMTAFEQGIALACKQAGVTRQELAEAAGVPPGELTNALIQTLVNSAGVKQ